MCCVQACVAGSFNRAAHVCAKFLRLSRRTRRPMCVCVCVLRQVRANGDRSKAPRASIARLIANAAGRPVCVCVRMFSVTGHAPTGHTGTHANTSKERPFNTWPLRHHDTNQNRRSHVLPLLRAVARTGLTRHLIASSRSQCGRKPPAPAPSAITACVYVRKCIVKPVTVKAFTALLVLRRNFTTPVRASKSPTDG